MLQFIPALLLILLQSGAEPDSARIRSHALSLMMGVQVRSELGGDLEPVGESFSDVQVQVLLSILADEPAATEKAAEQKSEPVAFPEAGAHLPASPFLPSARSRDGPLRT